MGVRLRLRVEVADEPGALATLAALIAAREGNITGIDVLHAPEAVIDDLAVEFGAEPDMADLRSEIDGSGAGRLISHQSAQPVDLVTLVLHRLAQLVSRPPGEHGDILRRAVADICASPHVWVATGADAAARPEGRAALDRPGEVELARSAQPLPFPAVTGEMWVLAVAPAIVPPAVVFAARPASQGYTTTEVSRVEALIVLCTQLGAG